MCAQQHAFSALRAQTPLPPPRTAICLAALVLVMTQNKSHQQFGAVWPKYLALIRYYPPYAPLCFYLYRIPFPPLPLRLHDVWDALHGERDDRPLGYTYDLRCKGDSKWRLRRLNKIHVSGVPKDMVMGIYTSVAPVSDHQIVVSQLERPKAQRVPSRF